MKGEIICVVTIVVVVVLGIWLCGFVMLYGGIMQAIENWGVDDSKVVWGIIRACCCWSGAVPSLVIGHIGLYLANYYKEDEDENE